MKTIIIYATKYGCTEKCAGFLKEKLSGEVDLHNLQGKKDVNLSQYERVILGGSIYMGKIRRSMTEFCQNNLNQLASKKIGLFICCADTKAPLEELKSNYPAALVDKAAVIDTFGGEVVLKRLSFIDRGIYKMGSKMTAEKGTDEAAGIIHDVNNVLIDNIDHFAQSMNETTMQK